MKKCDAYLAWMKAETFEGAEKETELVTWEFAKDIE